MPLHLLRASLSSPVTTPALGPRPANQPGNDSSADKQHGPDEAGGTAARAWQQCRRLCC